MRALAVDRAPDTYIPEGQRFFGIYSAVPNGNHTQSTSCFLTSLLINFIVGSDDLIPYFREVDLAVTTFGNDGLRSHTALAAARAPEQITVLGRTHFVLLPNGH